MKAMKDATMKKDGNYVIAICDETGTELVRGTYHQVCDWCDLNGYLLGFSA